MSRAPLDPRLQGNQMQFLLKKRNFLNSSELYEMMRSREVFQVQVELRKELERTIKALKNAEKMNLSSVMIQKSMFLKRVGRRNRNRGRLTNINAVTRSMENLDIKVKEDPVFLTSESQHHPLASVEQSVQKGALDRVPTLNLDFELSQSIDGNKSEKNVVQSENEAAETADADEEFYFLPSPNREWMDKIKELPQRKVPVSTKIYTKNPLFIQEKELNAQAEASSQKDGQNKDQPLTNSTTTIESSQDRPLKGAKITTRRDKKSVSTKLSPQSKPHVTFASVVDIGVSASKNKGGSDQLNKQSNVMLGSEAQCEQTSIEVLSQHGNRRLNESTEPENTNNKSALKSESLLMGDRAEPEKRCLLTVGHEAKGTRQEKSNVEANQCDPGGSPRKSLSPRKDNEIQPVISPRRPYLRRVTSPFASPLCRLNATTNPKMNREQEASNVQFLAEREKTVDMIFVEDELVGQNPQSLGISQFDIDALLEFRRRSRGHSKILSIRDLPTEKEEDIKDEDDDNKDKNKSKCPRRPKRNLEQRPKTFREKSQEWYLGFLLSRRNRKKQHNKPNDNSSGLLGRHAMLLNKFKALPKIALQNKSGKEQEPPDESEGAKIAASLKIPATREATELRLRKLKEHSRILQNKVDTFSPAWLLYGSDQGDIKSDSDHLAR